MPAKKIAKSKGTTSNKRATKPAAKAAKPVVKKEASPKKASPKQAAPSKKQVAPAKASPKAIAKNSAPAKGSKTTVDKVSASVQAVAKDLNAAKEKTLKAVVEKAKKMVKQAKEQIEKPAVLAAAPAEAQVAGDEMVAPQQPKRRMTKTQAAAMEKLGKMTQKWMALYRRAKTIKSSPYSMRSTYEAKTAIEHKILGWGYILTNKNDRLEVLFKDGVKFLISNYK